MLNLTKCLADRGRGGGRARQRDQSRSIATDRLQGRVKTLAAERGLDPAVASREMGAGDANRALRQAGGDRQRRCVPRLRAGGIRERRDHDVDGGATRTL
jgi:hypothetical protein